MKPSQRLAELFVLLLIVYSLVTYFLELEFTSLADHEFFLWSEWIVTGLFTAEFLIRWIASRSLWYPLRPMAIVDLLAILPFYVGFLVDLRALRLIRVLRIFRLFKLYRYTDALQAILNAFFRVRYEFAVMGFAVMTLGLICAVAVFEHESEAQPQAFARFSDAVWYTLTTLTTVGYGDKVPVTGGARAVASVLMIGGLGVFGTFVSLIGSAFIEEIRSTATGIKDSGDSSGPAPAGSGFGEFKARFCGRSRRARSTPERILTRRFVCWRRPAESWLATDTSAAFVLL
jgi:voltage-gated potassium channel